MGIETYTFRGQTIRGYQLPKEAAHARELALRTDVTAVQQLGVKVAGYLEDRGIICSSVIRPMELRRNDLSQLKALGLKVRRTGYGSCDGYLTETARRAIVSRMADPVSLNSLFHIPHAEVMGSLQGMLESPDDKLSAWNDLAKKWWLKGRRKTKIDLSGLDMSGLHLPGVILPSTDFTYTNLRAANMSGGWLSYSFFVKADLRNADMRSVYMLFPHFFRCDMCGSDFSGATISENVIRDIQPNARYDSLTIVKDYLRSLYAA